MLYRLVELDSLKLLSGLFDQLGPSEHRFSFDSLFLAVALPVVGLTITADDQELSESEAMVAVAGLEECNGSGF